METSSMQPAPTPAVKKKGNVLYKVVKSLAVVFVIFNLLLLGAGNYFYNMVITYNKLPKYQVDTYQKAVDNGDFDVVRFNSLPQQNLTLKSQHGYEMKGILVKNAKETPNTVVVVHGIGQDKWVSMKYADIFLDRGFNVLVYDSRNHGESGGEHPSYGYYEKEDLEAWVTYVKSVNPGGIIGVHGESLGAATILMHAEEYNQDQTVSFYIEDCAYSDLSQLYITRAGDYGVPTTLRPILVDYMSLVCKLRSGFFLGDVSPLEKIGQVETPVMFIHGEVDDFIPPQMASEMYTAKAGEKYLYIAKGADHAKSITVDKVRYREEVGKFLDQIQH